MQRPRVASTIHRIGGPSACSRIARRPSSRAIPSSWRRSATSSVCIWRRRIVPWFSVSTKRARSRPWTVPSPSCRCAPGRRSGAATTQAPRHDLSLRGPRHRHGRDHRQMFPAPSGPRVPQIPRPRRGERLLTSTYGYGTHKNPRLVRQRPRQAHFTPTSASWLNQVERWFTDKQIRPRLHQGAGAHHDYRHDKPEPQTLQMDADSSSAVLPPNNRNR